jgi:hypothetical protein
VSEWEGCVVRIVRIVRIVGIVGIVGIVKGVDVLVRRLRCHRLA